MNFEMHKLSDFVCPVRFRLFDDFDFSDLDFQFHFAGEF